MIYLASPLFNETQRNRINKVASFLRGMGKEVFVPMEHEVENAWSLSNQEWAAKVFKSDVEAINECDTIVCIYDGLYSDSGTAWELGYGMAKGKREIVLYTCRKNELQSLMVVNPMVDVFKFEDYEDLAEAFGPCPKEYNNFPSNLS